MIGQLKGASPSGYVMFFGDFQRNVYALDAATGKRQWKVNVESHPRGVLTGAPVLYKGLLYVPLSSWEETAGGVGSYGCCTARGGLGGAGRQGRPAGLENLCDRTGAATHRQEFRGHANVRAGGSCGLVGADHRCQAWRGLHRDRRHATRM